MNEKIVSQLDENNYFIFPVIADESPIEKGVYLIPAGAVDFPPPIVQAGSRAKWNGVNFVSEIIPSIIPTQDETIELINQAIQSTLESGARNWGYSSIVSASSYAASTNKQYAADAAALIGWRDEVWAWATPQFPNVTAGETPEAFMATMPAQPEQPKVS